ncbi:hypothetical protein Dvina_18985 [Dactylosporangium vinaceum]|uniref:Uncharacterized protein n=1 Tax=Dactylosporangium vinaceum TaxID=53362 RepID=A0ABV5M9C6_9ACTN|nr:hypothetical protein [Dactylosporangium vinaceum]UAB99951.1 hypothetical protein Dvina_18985 [Dactylosporangium vinaceum]
MAMAVCVASVGAGGSTTTASRRRFNDARRQAPVADVVFMLLTIAAFAVLGLAVRAVERL